MSFGRERRRWIRGEEAARKESGESTGRGDQGKCDLGACALCERACHACTHRGPGQGCGQQP
jgi:hypothetical protein